MPLSSIILLIAVSVLPGVKEYSSIKTSKINATKILEENKIDREKKVNFKSGTCGDERKTSRFSSREKKKILQLVNIHN